MRDNKQKRTVYLTASLDERLKEYCKKHGANNSSVLGIALKKYLDKEKESEVVGVQA